MNIYGKKVILRAVEESDCKMIQEMFNDPEIERSVVGWAPPLSLAAQKKWFESHMDGQNVYRFVIETAGHGAVGILIFCDIDWKNRHASIGIKLRNQEVRGKGIGTDAIMAMMRYAFDELNFNRLNTTRLEKNIASGKMFAKCGWSVEGSQRQYVYKNGSYHDMVFMGILKDEYLRLIKENKYWD